MSSAIVCKDLVVQRGTNVILKELSLTIESGQILGLLGPSGSGKTTLMRSIAGLQKIKSGEISVLGMKPGVAVLREKIAYSTQSASVYSDLTCEENLKYFASLFSRNEKTVDEILEEVDLNVVRNQVASSLSGGELSRLALATTLVGSPEILILDEPTVGLDPVLRIQLWELFNKLAAQGKTMLVSSHVMAEAEYCHGLALMRGGQILAHGTSAQLRAQTGKEKMEDVFVSLVKGP
ncbi:MAG: heme ABC exporter ATP-binding protein CcmA [Actinomycetes bacterium]